MSRLSPEEIDALTPSGRNRYADFLRVAAISVVVLGHWLLAVVTVQDGRMEADHLLSVVPATQWTTWVFQVMPLFFIVGGYANAVSLASAAQKGVRRTDWVRTRARRLVRPILPLLVVWVPLASLLVFLGTPTDLVRLGTQVVLVPVWFLAAYLGVVALAPVTYFLHRRYGLGALAGLAACAVALDALYRHVGPDAVGPVAYAGFATYFFVWGAIHQAGYFWADGRLPLRVPAALALAGAGYGALLLLTHVAGYPLSMVGGDETPTNTTPPSIALLALAAGQLGIVLALHDPVQKWLRRPRVWAPVVGLGSLIMTIYLWHMTAMVAVTAAAFPTGIWPATDAVDLQWWLTRPLWFACLGGALWLLVLAFGRFERVDPARPTRLSGWPARIKAAAGVVAVCSGLALLVLGGLYSERSPIGVPIVPLLVLAAGLVALGVVGARRGRSRRSDEGAPPKP